MELEQYHFVKIFLQQVEKYKDREALRHKVNGQWVSISWKQFGENVWSIARALLSNKLPEQGKIGVFSTNTPQWTMIDIASALLRASAVPIYATNTADQVAYIVNSAEIEFLFVGEQEQYDKALQIKEKCPNLSKIVAIKNDISLQTGR